jgi:hypothetical protein
MRRSQMATSLVRQPAPKFEIPSQERKYEKVIALFANVAEALARLNDNEFDDQYNQLLKIYGSFTTSMANVDTTTVTTDAADV